MSFIFPDPFLSKEQSFDTMLVGLEYKSEKQETPLLQPCGMVYEEDSGPLTTKCALIKATDCYSSTYDAFKGHKPVHEIENVPHWDTWIEEILNLAPQEKNQNSAEDLYPPRTINQYSLSQILELPGSKEPIIGQSLCCSGFDIKLEPFDHELCNATCSIAADNDRLSKLTETEKVCCSYVVSSTDCANSIRSCGCSSITGQPNECSISLPTQAVQPCVGSFGRCDPNETFGSPPEKTGERRAATQDCQSNDITSSIAVSKNGLDHEGRVKRKRRSYRTRKPRLCQFLVDILNNPERNPSVMEWIDETDGIFRFTNSAAVARMWGLRRHKPDMKYENFARSLRTYIAKGELRKLRSKLVYGFTRPENWFPKKIIT